MFKQPDGTLEHALEMGLNKEEYHRIIEILGRTPNYTELSIFSVMWSEHCSYKNSILQLKRLPRGGKRCLVEAGEENAGLIDIGDGLAVAFKIESHNHPSAIEPYQGAATGVGGIMRDIFTMGARPLAALNSLRFGDIRDNNRNKYLFENVVKGIGDYGNCLGIPTIAGEVYFEDCYEDNPLVNAMTIGVMTADKMASATAGSEKNPVFIFGSTTGRDGIHGATFASIELTDESESKKSSVQVGDPFTEKLLLEATLEMIDSGILIGIQDMGAAGITCSTSEMSGKTGAGMKIQLDKVPLREDGMLPHEIMLSESQERMLAVIKYGSEDKIKEICDKWDIQCQEIGEVTLDGKVHIMWNSEKVAEVPAFDLVLGGGAPVYTRSTKRPDYLDKKHNFNFNSLEETNLIEDIYTVLKSPNIVSRNWIYKQFDTQVRTNTIILPGGDASMFRIKGTTKGISSKIDCNARYVYLNPKIGTSIAVAESARNVSCTGAEPLAITNNLNFGNPYKEEMYYMFTEAISGMKEACEVFETPVTGGNVSFYNESERMAVYPTPTIGMIGLLEDYKKHTTIEFKEKDDIILLIGKATKNELGGSEWLKAVHNLVEGDCPSIDLNFEKQLQRILRLCINKNLISSAHDLADGGLIISLIESVINSTNKLGANINISSNLNLKNLLFSETQSRILVSCNSKNYKEINDLFDENNIKIENIGIVTNDETIKINNEINLNKNKISDIYMNELERIMKK